MPGPTTESINDDVKTIRDDLHKFQVGITADVRELSVSVKGLLGAIRILTVLTLTSLAGSIWWGATLTADVKNLGGRFDKFEAKVDDRLDKLESSIAKAIDRANAPPGPEPKAE